MNDPMLRNIADPVTTEIVRNFVVSCAEDMNASLWRSAHSAVIYEGRDSAVGLLDADGNMLGQSSGVPLFIGAIDANVHHVMEYYGDDIAPGDVFIMNDSYMQGSHLHDVSVVGPIFFDGELIGFGAARAHWNDIGAIDPGTVMGSTNIYQEGLRLGPTRIVAQGKPIREWFDLLRLNTRMPDTSIGDLDAQIAAVRTGERRLSQLLDRIGIETYRAACENIFEQARRMDREAIAAIKDGTWYREGYLDSDGAGDDPVKIALTLTVKGEELIVDLAGSSGIVPGSVNCGASQTVSLLRLAYKTMINPERAITGGSFETMTVHIPDDCLFNAKEPAACEWYFTGLGLLADLFISCLSEAISERSTAAHYGDSMVSLFFSVDRKRGQWMSIEATAGGWGGRNDGDGQSALINLVNGSFRNIPAEVMETKFPVRLEEFAIRPDSGGPGRHRGGCGVLRRYKTLEDCYCALWFERSLTPAWGLNGGKDARGPKVEITHPDGSAEGPLKMRARPVAAGHGGRDLDGRRRRQRRSQGAPVRGGAARRASGLRFSRRSLEGLWRPDQLGPRRGRRGVAAARLTTAMDDEPALRANGIGVAFAGVWVLSDVSVDILPGEIHGLIGENGAGKSTLGKVFGGYYAASAGTLDVFGERASAWDPLSALSKGVAIMHQELQLVPALTVAENVFLGLEDQRWGVLRRSEAQRLSALMEASGFQLDPNAIVSRLPIADQQKIEILRALARDARIIVMDEPTSSLSRDEVTQLHAAMRALRDEGRSIIYVSHFLHDILEVSDRITVLRDGKHVKTALAAGETRSSLVAAMLGGGKSETPFPPKVRPEKPEPVLEVEDLQSEQGANGANLSVGRGEIVGLTGLVGSGRSEIARAIVGADPATGGEVRLRGEVYRKRSIRRSAALGMVMSPEDRRKQGLILTMRVSPNMTLPHLGRFAHLGVMRRRTERSRAMSLIEHFRVRPADPNGNVATFSGGNQQKVLIGKWLMENPDIVILDEPSRGVDVGARERIHFAIAELAASGTAVLLISSEIEEVLGLAHRAYLADGGRIVEEVIPEESSEADLLALLFQHQSQRRGAA